MRKQKYESILLLDDNNSIVFNQKNKFNKEKFFLKKYLCAEGFEIKTDNFIIVFLNKKWMIKPSLFIKK